MVNTVYSILYYKVCVCVWWYWERVRETERNRRECEKDDLWFKLDTCYKQHYEHIIITICANLLSACTVCIYIPSLIYILWVHIIIIIVIGVIKGFGSKFSNNTRVVVHTHTRTLYTPTRIIMMLLCCRHYCTHNGRKFSAVGRGIKRIW